MCDEIFLPPILPPRQWSSGSWRGKFLSGSASPAAFGSLLTDADYENLCDMLDHLEDSLVEESHSHPHPRCVCAAAEEIPFGAGVFAAGVFSADVFGTAVADDCVSVSDEESASSSDSAQPTPVPAPSSTPAPIRMMLTPASNFMGDASDNRRCAIERWKVKRGKQKGLVKVCKARSDVALGRPRVKGKFVKKAQFVSITELQGY
jgi:hypothetical protein